MNLLIDQHDAVRSIAIDRPEVRNAVDTHTAEELYHAFLDFDADDAAAVAVLSGTGRAFCAGYDLKHAAQELLADWQERLDIPDSWDDPAAQPLPAPMGPTRLLLSKPVIAAISGPAVAGGMELAAWCDLRLVDESAYFGVYCRRWGVPLIDGGTVRLPAIVGRGRAMELILTGRRVDAAEALRIGLANRVVTGTDVRDAAIEMAQELSAHPQACLRADRTAAIGSPRTLAESLRREWRSAGVFAAEGLAGARAFASGQGRGGAPRSYA